MPDRINPPDPKPGDAVTVPVESAWYSKINWLNAIGGLGAITVAVTPMFDPGTQAKIATGMALASNIGSIILRTWFNGSVNPASLPSK